MVDALDQIALDWDGACDAHVHILGDPSTYPPDPRSWYVPTRHGLDDYEALVAGPLGLTRRVIVNPGVYGHDHSCTIDAIAAAPERSRGIAVLTPDASVEEIAALNRGGFRGVRMHLVGKGDQRASDVLGRLRNLAGSVGPFGWHVQVYAAASLIAELAPAMNTVGVPVVFDHLGLPKLGEGIGQPGFRALLKLLDVGLVWVKLSGLERAAAAGELEATIPFIQEILAVNPEQVVWGSDWPHINRGRAGIEYAAVDVGFLLRRVALTVPHAIMKKIMVDNPARLYRF